MDREYVFTHLDEFKDVKNAVVWEYLNHEEFTEAFILANRKYFEDAMDIIVKYRQVLSDCFFDAICTRQNYSHFKCLRRLKEPFRNFKELDDKFY